MSGEKDLNKCSGVPKSYGTYKPCKHGFPMTGACVMAGSRPICVQEELTGRLYNDTGGKPILTYEVP